MSELQNSRSSGDLDGGTADHDLMVRMFLRSYAFLELLYKKANYRQLHTYAGIGLYFTVFLGGFTLSTCVIMLTSRIPSVNPWQTSYLTWLSVSIALVVIVNWVVDRRIKRIPKAERPIELARYHTRRERLILLGEKVSLIPMGYVLHYCMTRIFS